MKKVASGLISLVIAGLIVFICAGGLSLFGKKTSYEVVLLGDSIVGNTEIDVLMEEKLSDAFGFSVLNGGFGGTCAAFDEENTYPASVSSLLSLSRLSRAIASGDYSVQKAQVAYGNRYLRTQAQAASYFEDRVTKLDGADFTGVKYLVIEHGSNDYNRGIIVENPQDKYDEATYTGALRAAIERLQKAYPDMQIVLMTPVWCYIEGDSRRLSCEDTDWGGGYLRDYVAAGRAVAAEYGLPVLDNYHEAGIGEANAELYLEDGIHLTDEGEKLIADRLAVFIAELENKRQ